MSSWKRPEDLWDKLCFETFKSKTSTQPQRSACGFMCKPHLYLACFIQTKLIIYFAQPQCHVSGKINNLYDSVWKIVHVCVFVKILLLERIIPYGLSRAGVIIRVPNVLCAKHAANCRSRVYRQILPLNKQLKCSGNVIGEIKFPNTFIWENKWIIEPNEKERQYRMKLTFVTKQ